MGPIGSVSNTMKPKGHNRTTYLARPYRVLDSHFHSHCIASFFLLYFFSKIISLGLVIAMHGRGVGENPDNNLMCVRAGEHKGCLVKDAKI
jgi:hypothetical protein